MKIVGVMIVAGCAMLAGVNAGGQDPVDGKASSTPAKAKRKWSAGVYRGLVMGKSSRADALKVLGTPVWTGKEEGTGVPMIGFGKVAEPVPGKLSVQLEHNVVTGMILEPEDRYTKDEIVKILGPGYTTGHYAEAECLSSGGIGGPLYEDARGDFEFVEYRARGIAVSIHKDGLVGEISFVKGPFGSVRSPCPVGQKKKPS